MSKYLSIVFSFVIFLLIFLQSSIVFAREDSKLPQDRFLVRFKRQIKQTQVRDFILEQSVNKIEKLPLERSFVLTLNNDAGYNESLKRLRRNHELEAVEPDYQAQTFAMPNDPYFEQQWNLTSIQAPQAWDLSHGSSGVKVAVLDTGIAYHQDLGKKISNWVNFTNSSEHTDVFGHGTHVAGIIGAITDNRLGVSGVSYEGRMMSVKVLGDQGSGYYSWIIQGIDYAVENGASVINMSLGAPYDSVFLQDAIEKAQRLQVLIVAAAGNNGNSSLVYPAAYKEVISVAALNDADNKASFSNYGQWVDIAAPGVSIFSTLPLRKNAFGSLNYGYASGTSMAAPHVSGLAALIFGTDTTLKSDQVRQIILENSSNIYGSGVFWRYGKLNMYNAINKISQNQILDPTPVLIINSPTPSPSTVPTATPTIILPTQTPAPTASETPSPTPTTESKKSDASKPFPDWVCKRIPRLCI